MTADAVMQFEYDNQIILGSGGNGVIFEGTWGEERVAVKRIPLERIQPIEREAVALRNCDHPNVIKLFHDDSDDDFRFFVLELCNASLDQLFLEEDNPRKYRGPMPATKKELCLQLAKGMAHIHERRLIHRDVKPGNVLIWVDSTGERVLMKWADFDLSKPVSERGTHTISGDLRGTRNWFAPETYLTRENPILPRGTVKSDVFGVGLVFGYYLLGGNHPFRGQYEYDTQINITENRFNLNGMEEHHPMRKIIMEMWNTDLVERISSSQVVEKISNIEGWEEPCIPLPP